MGELDTVVCYIQPRTVIAAKVSAMLADMKTREVADSRYRITGPKSSPRLRPAGRFYSNLASHTRIACCSYVTSLGRRTHIIVTLHRGSSIRRLMEPSNRALRHQVIRIYKGTTMLCDLSPTVTVHRSSSSRAAIPRSSLSSGLRLFPPSPTQSVCKSGRSYGARCDQEGHREGRVREEGYG